MRSTLYIFTRHKGQDLGCGVRIAGVNNSPHPRGYKGERNCMRKLSSIGKLRRKADIVFSKWIRSRDKKCFTCGATTNLQNGHFISRGKNNTRFDEENCHTQCVRCNVFLNGNYPIYAMKLGEKMVKELVRRGRILKQFKRAELEEIITKYQ